ncbi:MAG: TonB-dependent receptor plug domain-containing protein [Alphaproteobacteria bacterium]|nr:TonB-dependent receptor plug domain-containing protein [Alphaproteobacteria bacterium]MBU0834336.1 TonB-dependent receptor plug domain-containing protein [Alphaproteobacteria bacterium]MBU1765595.1 TonB-dependent receptor plug domain-containing protein [Alphaproteobacteria bacterium]
MAERRVSVGKRRLAMFMVSTALVSASAGVFEVRAQDAGTSPTTNGPRAISIPAQPLDAALRAFTRQTGWQVGYAAALVSGRTSAAVAGETDPLVALRALTAGAGIEIRVTGARTASLVAEGTIDEAAAAGTTVLEEITVSSSGGGVKLGTESAGDTGTTVMDSTQVGIRTSSGDANSFLRGLPNVQYQNDTNENAGVESQALLNTKPQEVSISGGRTYENNFILNGIGINTITGTEEPYDTGNRGELSDDDTAYNADRIYGLHSQTVFVPTDFVESATVIDSNASARYGAFQGGVVEYELMQPAADRLRALASVEYESDDLVKYNLATEDGLNPNAIGEPEFYKKKKAFSVTGPITDNIAVIGQYSVTDAWTNKAKNYIYGDELVQSESKNEFYRFQANAETDLGLFKLEGIHTDYYQDFESDDYRVLEIDTATRTYAGKLENLYEFEDFSLGGETLSNVSLTSKITASKSDALNLGGDNTIRNWISTYWRTISGTRTKVFESSMLDWCRVDPTSTTTTSCREGGMGKERGQGQESYTWSQALAGDIGNGTFRTGYEFGYTEAHRWRAEDYVSYTYNVAQAYTALRAANISTFTCNTTEECYGEQFAYSKTVHKAYDIHAQIMQANAYLELDQTFDWLNLRPGIRFDYDDYQGNLNISPRLVATVTPMEDFSISGGFNRYYDAANLSYAIRNQQPRVTTYSRQPSSTGAVGDFATTPTQTYYTLDAADLKTPYTDEFTAAINFTDPFTEGEWRFRYLHRSSRDQYSSRTPTNTSYVLTNNAKGSYDSLTAEYAKELPTATWNPADNSLLAASITWADKNVSADSYFVDEDDLEKRISYKGTSYTQAGFNAVTGNMDIPLRAQVGLSGSFFDERLTLGLAANYNFAYDGVEDTDDNESIDGVLHDIWDDKAFAAVLTVDLSGSYKFASVDDHGMTLNFKVVNLFNELGNAKSSNGNPWVIGRTLWVGASAEF